MNRNMRDFFQFSFSLWRVKMALTATHWGVSPPSPPPPMPCCKNASQDSGQTAHISFLLDYSTKLPFKILTSTCLVSLLPVWLDSPMTSCPNKYLMGLDRVSNSLSERIYLVHKTVFNGRSLHIGKDQCCFGAQCL